MQAVVQRQPQQGRVRRFQRTQQQRRVGNIEHRVRKGYGFGQHRPGKPRAERKIRHQRDKMQPLRQRKARRDRRFSVHHAGRQPAEDRGRQIVRVSFQLRAERQQLRPGKRASVQGICRQRAGSQHGRGRAEAAADRDLRPHAQRQTVLRQAERPRHAVIGADGQVFPVAEFRRAARDLQPALAALEDIYIIQRQRAAEGVEARPQIRRRRGDAERYAFHSATFPFT